MVYFELELFVPLDRLLTVYSVGLVLLVVAFEVQKNIALVGLVSDLGLVDFYVEYRI